MIYFLRLVFYFSFIISALFVPLISYAETINFAGSHDGGHFFGRSGDYELYAQQFTPSAAATAVTVDGYFERDSTFPYHIQIDIETDSGGSPSGVSMGSALYDATGIQLNSNIECVSDTPTHVTFPQVTGLTLSSGQTYWIVYSVQEGLHSLPTVPVICTKNDVSDAQGYYAMAWYSANHQQGSVVTNSGGGGGGGTASTSVLFNIPLYQCSGSPTTTCYVATNTPAFLQVNDVGNVPFGLAWLIFIEALTMFGVIVNAVAKRRT